MVLDTAEQLKQLLADKKNILIVFPKQSQGDAIGASVALALFLEKLGKRVDIASDNFVLSPSFKFLPKAKEIKGQLENLQKFIITLDAEKAGVHDLSYDLKNNKLRIFITPEAGTFTRENVGTAQSDFRYDLIIVLDAPDLEALGGIYDKNTEFFYKKPVINIDCHVGNEHFGQINLVEPNFSSTSEALFYVLEKLAGEHIDTDVATALLTGIIAKTHSFKSPNINPNTLSLAGKLINQGANRDYIVQNLYRTRSLSTLKLWGQALSHIQQDKGIGLVWTTITRDDFVRSGAAEEDLLDIIEELISNSPEAKLILLIHEGTASETAPRVNLILEATKDFNARELLAPYQPSGDKKQARAMVTGKTIKEVEEMVVEQIKKSVNK